MEKDKEELFDHIMSSLNTKLDSYKVGSMLYDDLRGYFFKCTDHYNNLSINEFLTLYKISLMKDKDIISNEEAVLLESLFDKRLQLNRRMGDLVYKDLYKESSLNNEQIQNMYQKVAEIDAILSKYHLLMNQDEYQNMLLYGIMNEDFSNLPSSKEIKTLIKSV